MSNILANGFSRALGFSVSPIYIICIHACTSTSILILCIHVHVLEFDIAMPVHQRNTPLLYKCAAFVTGKYHKTKQNTKLDKYQTHDLANHSLKARCPHYVF
jgi:hypothetical protein